MANVDLPAPLIPVSTMEASGSNILTEANSEPGRGELGAEREAVCVVRFGGTGWRDGEEGKKTYLLLENYLKCAARIDHCDLRFQIDQRSHWNKDSDV